MMLEPGHIFTFCYWPGIEQYEPEVTAALRHFLRPGHTLLDCGANVGLFSVMGWDLVGASGHVVSIEANPITFRLLQRNLAANHCGTAVHCALTKSPGEVELFMPMEGDVFSSLHKGGYITGPNIKTFRVNGRTLMEVLESLCIDHIDVMKIDIEGGELDVLRSSPCLLKNMRPVIICEYSTKTWPAFGASAEALMQLTKEYNYKIGVFNINTGKIDSVNNEMWRSCYLNLVLQPK
ncbi:MAG: FkbM family methyltransferase [Chthoniobacteraceae bacterium]